MSFIRYVERLRRMDLLIARRASGNPAEFAEKLGIRRSTLFQYLQEIRDMGIDVRYSNTYRSYYYANGKRISVKVEEIDQVNPNK